MEIIHTELEHLPTQWRSALRSRDGYKVTAKWREDALRDLAEGNRHQTFLRLASSLLNAKWSQEEAYAILSPLAIENKFDEDLRELVKDVWSRYGPEGRLALLQEKTRFAVSRFPSLSASETSYLKKTFPDLVHDCFALQDAFDKEAVAWLSLAVIWQGSQAEKGLAAWGESMQKLKSVAVCR